MPDLNEAARQTLEIAVANNDDVHVVVFIVIVDVNHYYVFFFLQSDFRHQYSLVCNNWVTHAR